LAGLTDRFDYVDRRAVTSISMRILGSASPAEIIVAAGRMLDLQVHDHVILGRDVYSFAERGELR